MTYELLELECCVPGCSTPLDAEDGGTVKLYRFPADEELAQKWREHLNIEKVSEFSRVCSLHFVDTDFRLTNIGWRVLLPSAIPSQEIQQIIQQVEPSNKSKYKRSLELEEDAKTKKTKSDSVVVNEDDSLQTVVIKEEPIDSQENVEDPISTDIAVQEKPHSDSIERIEIQIKQESNSQFIDETGTHIKQEPSSPLIEEINESDPIQVKEEPTSPSNRENPEDMEVVEMAVSKPVKQYGNPKKRQEENGRKTAVSNLVRAVSSIPYGRTASDTPKKSGQSSANKKNTNGEEVLLCTGSNIYSSKHYDPLSDYDNLVVMSSRPRCHSKNSNVESEETQNLSCTECGHAAKASSDLRKHMAKHSSPSPWLCDQNNCSGQFETKTELLSHYSKFHCSQRLYDCRYCQYCFSNRRKYVKHLELHGHGNKLYKTVSCKVCKVKFCDNDVLHIHFEKHIAEGLNLNGGESCEVRETGVDNSESTKFAEVALDVIKIEAMDVEDAIQQYEETSPRNNSFSCGQCDETFRSEKALADHSVSHTDVGEYNCIECGEKCGSNDELVKHYEKHVKEENAWSSDEGN